jgi:predicted deacetylase
MIPKPAQYLLRFDDLCPTIGRARWQKFLPLIEEFKLQPILAVVPYNRDPALQLSPPDPEFWDQMRALEKAGAAIALHGYRHLCDRRGHSLVPLHRHSEFAGVSFDTQRRWIGSGLEILRGKGLNPKLWVAPFHGFDRNTLLALREEGIEMLSDGLARVPFIRHGITWIPQQLWAPVNKPKGLWTICVHSNTVRGSQVDSLHAFLRRHAAQFTSVDRVLEELEPAQLGPAERLYEACALWRIQASQMKKRMFRKSKKQRAR